MMFSRKTTERIFGISFIYMAYYMLFSFINGAYTKSTASCLFMLTTYITYICSYFFGKYIKNIFIYITSLALLFLPSLFIKNATIVYKAMCFFILIASFKSRINKNKNVNIGFETMTALFVFGIGLYFLTYFTENEFMKSFIVGETVTAAVIALIYTHLKGINLETELTTAESFQSINEIIAFNNKALLCYIGTFIVVIWAVLSGGTEKVFSYIYNILIYIIRLLVNRDISQQIPNDYKLDVRYGERPAFQIDPGETPKWALILEEILIYTAEILIVAGIVAIIFITALNIYRRFHKNTESSDITEFVTAHSIRENIKKEKSPFVRIKDKTRRKFYYTVKRYYKQCHIRPNDTTYDIQEKISPKRDISSLVEEYRPVRYNKREND